MANNQLAARLAGTAARADSASAEAGVGRRRATLQAGKGRLPPAGTHIGGLAGTVAAVAEEDEAAGGEL